jgi:hypothetical protein
VKFAVDDALRNLVKHGCIQVVEGSLDGPDDDDEPVEGTEETRYEPFASDDRDPEEPALPSNISPGDGDKPPAPGATRKKWAEFLTRRGVPFPDGDESKGEPWAGRDDLVIIWQQQHGS